MKLEPNRNPAARRRLLTAGGGVGALAAAAAALPLLKPGDPKPAAGTAKDPRSNAGYRLSEHVRRYYETAKV